MMLMDKKKEINIRIANMLPFSVSVTDSAEEEVWLEAADRVNHLWLSWTKRFPEKSSEEVLGMVTLRFAQAFVLHSHTENALSYALDDLDREMEKLLQDGAAIIK